MMLRRAGRTFATAAIPAATTKFLLSYDYVADILEKRAPHRPAHVERALAEVAAGRLEQAGAVGDADDDAPSGALFVFTTDSTKPVEAFVRSDPYYIHGLVPSYSIQEWTVVVKSA